MNAALFKAGITELENQVSVDGSGYQLRVTLLSGGHLTGPWAWLDGIVDDAIIIVSRHGDTVRTHIVPLASIIHMTAASDA